MSSDTAKENASVVDSSVTEWKQEIGNSDDPESSSNKPNEDGNPTIEDIVDHSHGWTGNSVGVKLGKLYETRYFIIKSLNHHNIQLSIEKGIWATQVMNEPILEEAFHSSSKVILIFSVNMSGSFQGYAQMMSSVGWRRDNAWSQGSGKNNPWGRSFKVKWLQLNDLPFQRTLHLKNPLNDYKPVKISRDCQELAPDIGEALCELLDEKSGMDGLQRSFSRNGISSKRACMEGACSVGDNKYNMHPLHISWSTPMMYPSLVYQHQAEVNRFLSVNQRTSRTKVVGTKHSHHSRLVPEDRDMGSQLHVWGLSGESPLESTLTEADFLDMSYEEYLEVHGQCSKQLCFPSTVSSWEPCNSSRSRKRETDGHSSFSNGSRKRIHHSSSPQK